MIKIIKTKDGFIVEYPPIKNIDIEFDDSIIKTYQLSHDLDEFGPEVKECIQKYNEFFENKNIQNNMKFFNQT